MMARILKRDVERLVELRDQMKALKSEEQELASKLKENANGKPVRRGDYEVSVTEYAGSPKWKDAFIEYVGEEIAETLPRPAIKKLLVKPIKGK